MSDGNYLKIAAAVISPNIGGWMGRIITKENIQPWYASLNKPKWNPPNYVFGPVWTGIYCGMGYSSYLVYDQLLATGNGFNRTAQVALALYAGQMALNWAWTPIFFKYHSLKWVSIIANTHIQHHKLCTNSINFSLAITKQLPPILWPWILIFALSFYLFPGQSAVELSVLTVSAAACGYAFGQINRTAGYLFIPYIAWLSFATCLNATIYRMNKNAIDGAEASTSKTEWLPLWTRKPHHNAEIVQNACIFLKLNCEIIGICK